MKYLDKLTQEHKSRQNFTAREIVIIACALPFLSACLTFGGAHPLVHAFSDPASDRVGPWLGVVSVGLFWLGTFAFWVWAFRWYKRQKSNNHKP